MMSDFFSSLFAALHTVSNSHAFVAAVIGHRLGVCLCVCVCVCVLGKRERICLFKQVCTHRKFSLQSQIHLVFLFNVTYFSAFFLPKSCSTYPFITKH